MLFELKMTKICLSLEYEITSVNFNICSRSWKQFEGVA